jgi:hypothetical protein
MKLPTAELVAGSETPAGDGISGALRCVLRLPDRSQRSAILKRGPLEEIAAEAFAALLLRAWSLPVPDPYLVVDGNALSFGSADVGYPNLKQALGLAALPVGPAFDAAVAVALSLATSLPTAPLAAACDEAIENRDRNLGNVLWDGQSEAWIDHALALGRGHAHPDQNKLCAMVAGKPDQDRFSRATVAQALLLDRAFPGDAEAVTSATAVGMHGHAAFVAGRLASLGNRLVARFPTAADLLSGP